MESRIIICGIGDIGNMNSEIIRKATMLNVEFIHIDPDPLVLMEPEYETPIKTTFSYTGLLGSDKVLELKKFLEAIEQSFEKSIENLNDFAESMKQFPIAYDKPQSKFISRPLNNFRTR